MQQCAIRGCEKKYYALGYCQMHWQRVRKHGDPLGGRTHASLEDRFWRYVKKRSRDDCWLWTAKVERNGYGRIQEGGKGSSQIGAHRLSFRIANGFDPEVVMHTCDNPPCVNPAHLRAGTFKENTADMIAKGRKRTVVPLGTNHPRAKLTEDQVRFIRNNPDIGHKRLAKMFEVGPTTIRSVRSGKNWAHLE